MTPAVRVTVAVGMPIHNGMPHLSEAIDAVVGQDYTDLEIVLCDNASDDGTEALSRAWEGRDHRIRYTRFDVNAGAAANFNRAFELTSAPFFTWAADDDRMRPGYVRRCLETLQQCPDAAMCVPSVTLIGEEGCVIGHVSADAGLSSPSLAVRLRSFLHRSEWLMIYGVARREALADTSLLQMEWGADVALLWKLLLVSPFCVLDEELLEYRRGGEARSVEGVLAVLVPPAQVVNPSWAWAKLWRSLWNETATRASTPAARRVARRALMRWAGSTFGRALIAADLSTQAATTARENQHIRAFFLRAALALVAPRRTLRIVLSTRN